MNANLDGRTGDERWLAYRVLRYSPYLVRDEWVNIGVLAFDPASGEWRLRTIEEENEIRRVMRLHPRADESLLRGIGPDLEDRLRKAPELFATPQGAPELEWLRLLGKWDEQLSNTLQLAPQKGVYASDLDLELERLYTEHVSVPRSSGRALPEGSRPAIRSYCSQVLKQARLWERMQKSIRAEEFTFAGDPMRLDFGYRRNGTHGFLQTLSVSRAPADAKLLAYTVDHIRKHFASSEFTAVTDVALLAENDRHRFVQETLREAGVAAVPMEGFAVWTAKMRPMIQ